MGLQPRAASWPAPAKDAPVDATYKKGIMIMKSAIDRIPVGMSFENYALRSLNTRASASATEATRKEATRNVKQRRPKGECMLKFSAQGNSGRHSKLRHFGISKVDRIVGPFALPINDRRQRRWIQCQ